MATSPWLQWPAESMTGRPAWLCASHPAVQEVPSVQSALWLAIPAPGVIAGEGGSGGAAVAGLAHVMAAAVSRALARAATFAGVLTLDIGFASRARRPVNWQANSASR